MKEFEVGQGSEFTVQITEESNKKFNDLTGDTPNPAHFEKEAMKKTFFKRPIASGIQTLSAIGCTMRRLFVSEHTMPIATEITVSFKKPVYVGDVITCKAKIFEISKPGTYAVAVTVFTQEHIIAAEASFLIKVVSF